MKISKLTSSLCIALLIVSAGNAQTGSRNDWTMVQQLRPGDKLAVWLKSGETVKGVFAASTETTLSLSEKTGTTEVERNNIAKVHRVSGKSIGTYTIIGTGIGAAAGAVTGASLGDNCSSGKWGCPIGRANMALAGAGLFAIIGTGVGLILGLSGHHGDLIYEAP
jgi:hypothetical protein